MSSRLLLLAAPRVHPTGTFHASPAATDISVGGRLPYLIQVLSMRPLELPHDQTVVSAQIAALGSRMGMTDIGGIALYNILMHEGPGR